MMKHSCPKAGLGCCLAMVVLTCPAFSAEPGVKLVPAHFHAAPKPLPAGAVTGDWPRFLGSAHNGISPETKLLKHLPPDGPALVWEMPTGDGYAAPSVAGDRLVFFHGIGDRAIVECLHAETGRRLWSFDYPTDYKDRYGFNGGPRASPVIDGDRVFTFGVQGRLHCLDLSNGAVVWRHDTSKEFKVPQDFFGAVSTPLVEGDLLIVNVGAPGGPCVVAFDKATGKVVWKAGDQWGPSCASPIPAVVHDQRRVLVFAGGDSEPPTGGLLVLDPKTGRIDTRFPFRSKDYISINAASPVFFNDRVFLTTSYKTGGVLLDLRRSGLDQVAWRSNALGAHFATPIYFDGYLYGIDGGGKGNAAIVCVDVRTGKRVWREQPEWKETVQTKSRQRDMTFTIYRGSLLRIDGRFLCLTEMGHLLWLDLSPTGCNVLSRSRLFLAGQTWTPPVVSRGLLYITQNEKDIRNGTPPRLLCYDFRGKK